MIVFIYHKIIKKAKEVFVNFCKKVIKEILCVKKRRDSCTARGNFNFSYRLVMAPIDVN
jgi:predicted metal-dependent hydrolase